MAQTSWPFENIDTTEVQFSQWARHINEGIRPDFANELEPFADDSGLNVKVKSGQAMVRGHYYASTAEETLTITTPDATNPRIDSVVLELDIVANSILLKVVAGTPDASPVAPTLTQSEDGNVYQFLLGNVAVAAGVFSIEAGDVTDLRTYMFQGVGKWTTDTRPENPIEYQTIGYNTDLNTHEVWNGTAWTSVFAPITTEGDLAIGDNTGTAVRLPIGAAETVLTSNGTTATWAEAGGGGGFNTITEVTASDASFDTSAISGFTRITLVAGGGGGTTKQFADGGDGGDTSIVISGTTTTADGGSGALSDFFGDSGSFAFASSNFGYGGGGNNDVRISGQGGEVKIFYSDLTGISTVNITIGAGGSGEEAGGNGFRGLVILEYTS